MAQVALAWILSRDFITAPIVGTTSLDKLKDLLGTFFFFFLENPFWRKERKRPLRRVYRCRQHQLD